MRRGLDGDLLKGDCVAERLDALMEPVDLPKWIVVTLEVIRAGILMERFLRQEVPRDPKDGVRCRKVAMLGRRLLEIRL